MKIINLQKTHLKDCLSLFKENVSDESYHDNFHKELKKALDTKDKSFKACVAIEDNQVIGVCIYAPSYFDNSIGIIIALYVKPSKQHRGVGSALLNKVLKYFTIMGCDLCMLTTNQFVFYERFGFKKLNTKRKEWYILCKDLAEFNY